MNRTHTSLEEIPATFGLSFACLATLLAFALGSFNGTAAEKPVPAQAAEARKSAYDLEIVNGVLRGYKGEETAKLGHVVDFLREQFPVANIVLSPGLADVPIADLKLRAGGLIDYLEALSVASGNRFSWERAGAQPPAVDPTTGLPVPNQPFDPNAGLFVLRQPNPTPETERNVEVFNLTGYFEQLGDKGKSEWKNGLTQIEEIIASTLTRLQEARAAGPGASLEKPSFEFHSGANLLIVIGSNEALNVARRVVNALQGQTGMAAMQGKAPSEAENEAFRARYGLAPRSVPMTPGGRPPPQGNPANPNQHP